MSRIQNSTKHLDILKTLFTDPVLLQNKFSLSVPTKAFSLFRSRICFSPITKAQFGRLIILFIIISGG